SQSGISRRALRLPHFHESSVEDHLRNLRRFSGASGRDQDETICLAQMTDDFTLNLPNGKRVRHDRKNNSPTLKPTYIRSSVPRVPIEWRRAQRASQSSEAPSVRQA